jgi:hypothetical protein
LRQPQPTSLAAIVPALLECASSSLSVAPMCRTARCFYIAEARRQFSPRITKNDNEPRICGIIHRSYALALFGGTQRVPDAARFACGSMVRFDHTFVIFALYERKNDKQEKEYRCAESQHANCVSHNSLQHAP